MNAVIEHGSQVPVYHGEAMSTAALILDGETIDCMMRVAEIMATGKATVPQHLRGSHGDCLAVVMQAMQWKMNPFAVAQKTHLVNGALGYEAQLVIAVIQASGAIQGRFHYEYQGEGNALSARVGATIRGESEITWSEWLKVSDVTTKNSPLWKTNPKQQLGYLQAKNWSRLYCPGAILGVYTPDELQDGLKPAERDITPAEQTPTATAKPASRTAALKDKLVGKTAGHTALPAPTFDAVTEAIRAASCKVDMDKAKELVNQLPDDQRPDAVGLFNERAQQLREMAAKKQADTPTFDVNGFANRLQSCADLDTLDLMADELRSISDLAAQAHLEQLYQERRAELMEG